MKRDDAPPAALAGLAENVDDLLEALSALQLLSDLPAHKLTESTLLKELLHILYQSCRASSCTVITWGSSKHPEPPSPSSEINLLAIDSNGISHHRIATAFETFFINETIVKCSAQQCSNCASLGADVECSRGEKSIISVPIFARDELSGVITLSHSDREHYNQWYYNLMNIISKFFAQQLTICRLQN